MQPYRVEHSMLTGPLRPASDTVRMVDVLDQNQKATLTALTALNIMSGVALLTWVFWPSSQASGNMAVGILIIVLMAVVELFRIFMAGTLSVFAAKAQDPVPMVPPKGLRVALLTTLVPDSEPWSLISKTVQAMRRVTYDGGTVEVTLLDEGDNPLVQNDCAKMGVLHSSRLGYPEYNRPAGPFKELSKHGNHNSWGDVHGEKYDIVGQMDPDHVPFPDFLERTLGYFNDPDVAYVVAPQVYGNVHDSFVTEGSAQGAYIFHGIVQRGGNGLGAPLLIGTNHLYRVSAWRQNGGYTDSLIEDHATALTMLSEINPDTGRPWKGIYTPDILAVGEGPTSFHEWNKQQKRWSYGIWDVMFRMSGKYLPKLATGQRLAFAMLQAFYPIMGLLMVMGNLTSLLFLLSDYTTGKSVPVWFGLWALSFGSTLGLFLWLRRFNLVEHERRAWAAGMLLSLMTLPIYVSAMLSRWVGRALTYGVTAKGHLASAGSPRTFASHFIWAALALSLLVIGFTGLVTPDVVPMAWLSVTIVSCLAPPAMHYWTARRTADAGGDAQHDDEIVDSAAVTRPLPRMEAAAQHD